MFMSRTMVIPPFGRYQDQGNPPLLAMSEDKYGFFLYSRIAKRRIACVTRIALGETPTKSKQGEPQTK